MPRYEPMGDGVLRPDERHPLLGATGAATLDALIESPGSPRWSHQCGDRLDAAARDQVVRYASTVRGAPPRWDPHEGPPWLAGFLQRVATVVPRYRRSTIGLAPPFTTSRDDLVRAWWDLVPDDVDLDELIWFPTSGTGGQPAIVPTHPVAVSAYYPLLLEAARGHGVEDVRFRDDRVDWLTVFDQTLGGFTVPSWSSVLGCATAKVNLQPSGWAREGDLERFLAHHDPRVITGDPVSFAALADLTVDLHPRVLISTATRLTGATRARLEERFGCPVVDVYSTTESGPIAASRPAGGMALLQPQLHVEIVDDTGLPRASGERGTVTVTGGMNPYLPLVRYRTGDAARLVWEGNQPVLFDLDAREAVLLRAADDAVVNSIDVTIALEELPLRRWSVQQRADRSIVVAVEGEVDDRRAGPGPGSGSPVLDGAVRTAVQSVLGAVPVTVEALATPDKVVPFTVEEPS